MSVNELNWRADFAQKGARMEEKEEEQAREEETWEQPLPTFDDLVHRFSLFSASSRCNTQIGNGGSLYCKCEGCSEWHAFVEGRPADCKQVQYEVFTLEHVKGLAHYLLVQATEYKLPVMNVLEVGAGSGLLCQYLNYFLAQPSLPSQGCNVQLTATDSGERGLNGIKVVKKDALEAISEAMPHVVLVSWMPIGVDWTAHMRATPSVIEYILIGEIDGGICGDPWLTWGYVDADNFSDSSSEDPASLSMSDGSLKINSFSNYGPGRPADMAEMGSKIIPFQSWTEQGNYSEQLHLPSVVEREGRVVDMLVGSAQIPKRLKLCPESTLESFPTGALLGAISGPMSSPGLTRICDTHENPASQHRSKRKNVDVLEIMPPYEVDGWVRTELISLSSLQVCRTDERWSTLQHSHTVSFRRNPICDTHTHKESCQ